MSSYEDDNFAEREPDDFGFNWVEEEALTPEIQALLEALSVPVRRSLPRLAEVIHTGLANEVQQRLAVLRVEGYSEVGKSHIKITPELQMTPYILDDVHYEVYRRRKLGALNRFVSVNFEEIIAEFQAMHENRVNGVLLQRKQNDRAVKFLVNALKIDEGSIYETMGGSSPEGRFVTRSLHRLLAEDSMRPFTKLLPKAATRRIDESPLVFDEVAEHALHFIDMKYRQHESLDTSKLSTDQRIIHQLLSRDLERAKAFAMPVSDYIGKKLKPEQAD